MKTALPLTGLVLLLTVFALSSCAVQEGMAPSGMAPAAHAPEMRAKPVRVSGDVGLLDTEKNYVIVVTKEGKLVSVDFDENTKVTKYVPQKAKVDEVTLGTSGTATYKPKVVELETLEFKVKPKKDN